MVLFGCVWILSFGGLLFSEGEVYLWVRGGRQELGIGRENGGEDLLYARKKHFILKNKNKM